VVFVHHVGTAKQLVMTVDMFQYNYDRYFRLCQNIYGEELPSPFLVDLFLVQHRSAHDGEAIFWDRIIPWPDMSWPKLGHFLLPPSGGGGGAGGRNVIRALD
jgi:hypothetical protein